MNPKYSDIKEIVVEMIQKYFQISLDGNLSNQEKLEKRKLIVQNSIDQFPKNIQEKNFLLENGYSESLWSKPLEFQILTDGSMNNERFFFSFFFSF